MLAATIAKNRVFTAKPNQSGSKGMTASFVDHHSGM